MTNLVDELGTKKNSGLRLADLYAGDRYRKRRLFVEFGPARTLGIVAG